MNKKEILEKLKKKELLEKKKKEQEKVEYHCIMYNICPDCGADLIRQGFDKFFCPECKIVLEVYWYHSSRWIERKKMLKENE